MVSFLKEAGLENSGITDSESGKTIFVSTSARKFFREAYPAYGKIRNNIMNQYIAKMFAVSRATDSFKPKSSSGAGTKGEVGEIRETGGGKFVGIISANHVRIIAVKGAPGGLPGLPQVAAPGGTGGPSGGSPGQSAAPQEAKVPGFISDEEPGAGIETALESAI